MEDYNLTKKRKLNEDSDKNNTVIKIKLSDFMREPLPVEEISLSNSSYSVQEDSERISNNSQDYINSQENTPEKKDLMENLGNPHSFDEKRSESDEYNNELLKNEMEEKLENEERDKEKIRIEQEILMNEIEKNDEIGNNENISLENKMKSWKVKKPIQKNNNLLNDFVSTPLSNEEIIKISMERASKFNERIIYNKAKIAQISKQMENQKLSQRFALDNSNSVFPSPFIPLFKLMENGNLYYETNGCLEMEKESIEKFITLNVNNEHYNFSNDQSSRFAMFYPRRFPRRRRRRRNTAKFLAESVEPINK